MSSATLAGGGITPHFVITYDDGNPAGLSQAQGLLANCEFDYNLLRSWFGGIDPSRPITLVTLANVTGGAETEFGLFTNYVTLPALINEPPPQQPLSVNNLRQLLAAEMSEVFMEAQGGNWWVRGDDILGIPLSGGSEGSRGEGLSRFLSVQILVWDGIAGALPPPGFQILLQWLNSSRADYVTFSPNDNGFNDINGCTTLFIYYLYDQLGYGIEQIISTGMDMHAPGEPLILSRPSYANLYRKLTGRTDAWESFIALPGWISFTGPPLANVDVLVASSDPATITIAFGKNTVHPSR